MADSPVFRSVSGDEFRRALADCSASPAFREVMSRLVSFDDWMNTQAAIHEGSLKVVGSLAAPALCTLITGDLDVEDVLDIQNGAEQGLFIVVGNVRCRHFISAYDCCSIIDGDLEAGQSLINGFPDSGLWVTGGLRTRLFIGFDIWAEVGAGAVMDYGIGYCLPLGYTDAVAEAIAPLHDEEETAQIVVPEPAEDGYGLNVKQFVDLIRAGRPIFR
ncbi:MAG: hypothetical protein JOY64_01215 [Alphaproteobacteria bacterium]|nr:hypothetical protein [Alphaproteobacteria bacterium]MBV8406221.1 hypothetical protein [Alphaproteobacteria bacterium]